MQPLQIVSVLLSASVERFFVSRMPDFFLNLCKGPNLKAHFNLHVFSGKDTYPGRKSIPKEDLFKSKQESNFAMGDRYLFALTNHTEHETLAQCLNKIMSLLKNHLNSPTTFRVESAAR